MCPGMVVHTGLWNPSYLRDRGRKILDVRPALAELARPYLKNKLKGLGWGSSDRA
jgi:hypothetical protein